MPNIYKINVSPKPLTNLTAVLTFTDDSTSTRTDWIEADTYYTITETTIKTLKSLTVSANNYITQTLETSDLDIDITLSPNIKYVSKIKNNGVVYTLKDESVDGKVEGLANKTLSNVSSIDNNSAVTTALNGKQATLVSGTNIKTINNTSLLGSGNIDANNIFIAEYGVTSYSDIDTAYNAGKMLFVVEGDFYYPLMSADSSGYVFSSPDSDGIYQVYISSDGTWSGNEYGFPTKISDLTDDTSTYPISKADTLTGLTATISELNILDGATLSTTELNYVDGVTSSIQTQLNNKQDTLVSGTNIKTINNNSLLGSGDITIDSLPSQSGQSGKFLTTNGTTASWSTVSIPTVDQIFDSTSTNAQSGVAIGNELVNYVNGRNGNIEISNDGVLADITYSYIDNDTLQEQYSVQVGATMMGHGTLIGAKDYTDSEDLKEFGVAVIPEGFGISDGNQNVLLNISNNNLTVNGTEVALTTDIPDISTKQDTLVSGTNIKTVNNTSLLGSGNLSVGTVTSVNNTAPVNGDVTISIPTVNNATLTIQKNGTTVNTFTANSSSDVTANITVPTDTSDLTNNAGFITNSALSGYVQSTDLATVATSGSYNDLSNKPTIPNAQIQSDWNQTDNNAVDFIKNKPTIPSGVVVDQVYDGTSTNAQSGVAIEGELSTNYVKTENNNTFIDNGGTYVNCGYEDNDYFGELNIDDNSAYLAFSDDQDYHSEVTVSPEGIGLSYNYMGVGIVDSGNNDNVVLTVSNSNLAVNGTEVALSTDIPTNISDLTDDTATNPVDKADTLTGLTATITELNYTDGVTSNIQTQFDTITGKIPSQASTSNQLADKAFVNSSVQTATANFRGNWDTWTLVPTSASSYPADYAGSTTPTVNDYLVVQDASDYTGDTLEGTWRFKYTGVWSTDGKSGWNPEYQVNETPLTSAQLAALNSGITSGDVTLIGTALQPNDNISELTNDARYIVNKTSATNAISILGSTSTAGISIGPSSSAVVGSVSIGNSATTNYGNNVAIGNSAQATGNNSNAIGYNAKATANTAIQIGNGTNSTASTLQVGFGTTNTNWQLLNGSTGLIPDARLSSNIARTSAIPTVPTNISAFTNDSEYITSSALTDYVTTNTDQNITGTKTYVGQKKIGFKQSSSSDKLGFTLYNNSGTEKGYLEYNPSNTVDSVPLMTLGNYATASGGLTHVGFRKYSSISGANGAYNLLAPLISDAKTPFNLTTTYTNFYLPLGFTDGTTTVTTAKSGLCDLSSILPDISTKQDTLVSGTNIKTINNTSLLGSGNIKVAPDEGSKSTDTLYVGSNTSLYEGINSTGLGYRHNVTGIANIAIGTTATAGDNIGTYIEPVYTTNCIAIGVGATAQVNSSIQIGRGTNPTANSLNVGFTDAKTNYQLLDGTTGLIPDARISTNIARTSSVADSTLSNVSSISSNSAVATALDSKVNTSDIWYDSTSKTLYIGVAQS